MFNNKSFSDDSEAMAVSRLKVICGTSFVLKIETLMTDYLTSKTWNEVGEYHSCTLTVFRAFSSPFARHINLLLFVCVSGVPRFRT